MFTREQQIIRKAMIGVYSVLIVLSSPPAGLISAQEPLSQAERDEAELILRGVIAERDKIRSGFVRLGGTRLYRASGYPELKDDSVDGLFAFDLDRDWIRYDNTELQYVRHINSSNAPNELDADSLKEIPVSTFRRRLCYVRNDEYSTWWSQSGPTSCSNIQLFQPDTELNSSLAKTHHFCDFRAAGVMDYRDFQKFVSVQSICESLLEKVPLSDFERNLDVVSLTFENEGVRIAVEIDTSDGFRPLSRVVTPRGGVPYRSENKAVWERRGGVDVPVRMTVQWEFPDQEAFTKYDLTLDWQSVNEPVDPKLFDYRSFPDIPTDLAIAVRDARGEERVTLGMWAGTGKELKPDPNVPPKAPVAAQPPAQSSRVWIFVVFNTIAILVVAFAFWWRRRRRLTSRQ
jgi:hypothetical protein